MEIVKHEFHIELLLTINLQLVEALHLDKYFRYNVFLFVPLY